MTAMAVMEFKKVWGNTPTDAVAAIKRIESASLTGADYVLLRATDKLVTDLRGDPRACGQIAERAGSALVFTISFDPHAGQVALNRVADDGLRSEASDVLLQEIRNEDLSQALIRSGDECVLTAPPGAHFLTPSKRHSEKFVRIADALNRLSSAERVAFWLAPEVAKCGGVIADSWALGTAMVLAIRMTGQDIPFDCLPAHVRQDEPGAQKTIQKVHGRLIAKKPLLFLVSLTSSGTFLEDLGKVMARLKLSSAPRILSVFKTENAVGTRDALARIPVEISSYDQKNCPHCHGEVKASLIEIDPRVYFPRPPRKSDKILKLAVRHIGRAGSRTAAYKAIMGTFAPVPGALKIHYEDPNDGVNPRHHAFYIDVGALCQHEATRIQIEEKLKAAVPVASPVVVLPPHPAGRVLGQLAQSVWGARIVYTERLTNLSADDQLAIRGSESIVVLDDVVITGTRFRTYLRNLREGFTDVGGLPRLKDVYWIPVVARPERAKQLEQLRSDMTEHSWTNHVLPLFEVILPNWSTKKCPWCREVHFLVGELEQWDIPDWVRERSEALRTGDQSKLGVSPLLRFPGTTIDTLAQASPLADSGTTELTVMFILAHLLQKLRDDPSTPLERSVWRTNTLDLEMALSRYSEPLIQSCILRVVGISEWSHQAQIQANELMGMHMARERSSILHGESLLFLRRMGYCGKLEDNIVTAVKAQGPDPAVERLLQFFAES